MIKRSAQILISFSVYIFIRALLVFADFPQLRKSAQILHLPILYSEDDFEFILKNLRRLAIRSFDKNVCLSISLSLYILGKASTKLHFGVGTKEKLNLAHAWISVDGKTYTTDLQYAGNEHFTLQRT